jgi:polyferredoxin
VAVCPYGIDIRNGYQLECIACARCVDACEDVMGRLGHDSLVRYTTLAEQQGGARHRLRPRTAVYAALLAGIAAAFIAAVSGREPFEATVSRVPGSLFSVDADGWVRNTYLLRITNNAPSPEPLPFEVQVQGLADAQVVARPVTLGTTESATLPLVVRVPPSGALPRTVPIHVLVASPAGRLELDATFKTGAEASDAAIQ